MIRLANRSRSNRMFYDNLVKEIAICINMGYPSINRELELPSYRGISSRKGEDVIDIGNNHAAIGFDTPAGMLPPAVLRAIDGMMEEAKKEGLAGCGSRRTISDFIISHTDLTDCHLSALNEMYSLA